MENNLKQLFPKEPYSIQLQIATEIYSALEQGSKKALVIESPTGTGKTYSLLVPIISWLKAHPDLIGTKNEPSIKSTVPNWIKKPTMQKGAKIYEDKKQAIKQMKSLKEIV